MQMTIIENTTERVLCPAYLTRDVKSPTKAAVQHAVIPPGCHRIPLEGVEILLEHEQNAYMFEGTDSKLVNEVLMAGRDPMLRIVDAVRQGDTHEPQTIQMEHLNLVIRQEKPKK